MTSLATRTMGAAQATVIPLQNKVVVIEANEDFELCYTVLQKASKRM